MNEEKKIRLQINSREIKKLIILLLFPLLLLVIAFIFDSPNKIISGLNKIIFSRDILLTDYLEIAGIGATFVNISIITIINIIIICKLRLKLNGFLIAAIFSIIGYAFFGKNLFNVWPMYLGGIIYAKHQKIPFKNILVIIMFSTALAPAISELAFCLDFPPIIGFSIAVLFGMFCGYIISPLAANMNRIHDGYNLYNVGFTVGIIGTVLNSILRSFGITVSKQQFLSTQYDTFFKIFLTLFFALLIIIGFILNNKSFKGYKKIMHYSGKLITDFTQLVGYGLTFINMGIMGLISILFVIIIGKNGVFNGPVVGAIFAVTGFAAFGKHPKNTIPIMIGIYLAGILKIWDMHSTQFIIAGLFGTTLAPIAGKYGTIAGIIAGFLHLSVSMNVGLVHGGLILYNNGFSGGLVASILFPLFDTFKKGD